MTPLAGKFATELCLPMRSRRIQDKAGIFERMPGLHCFECSEISEAVMSALEHEGGIEGSWTIIAGLLGHTFLPSERTWLESSWAHRASSVPEGIASSSGRMGIMLEFIGPEATKEDAWPAGRYLDIRLAMQEAKGPQAGLVWTIPVGQIRPGTMLDKHGIQIQWNLPPVDTVESFESTLMWVGSMALLELDILNEPSLVIMHEHAPHKGLQKKLTRSADGHYPLKAWHEVRIRPGAPIVEDGVGHLTGRKCLHFVRSHRRLYRAYGGKEAVVKAHWRGDPALGIQRTRYKVERSRS